MQIARLAFSNNPIWKGTKGKILKILIIFVSLIALLLISWGIFASIYKNKIFPNISMLGIEVGGLSQKEATIVLASKAKQVEQKKIKFISDSKKENLEISLKEIGVDITISESLKNALSYGREKNLFLQLKHLVLLSKGVAIDPEITIFKDQLNSYLEKFITENSQELKQPYLQITNGVVEVKPGQAGVAIDKQKLENDLTNFAKNATGGTIDVKTEITDPDNPDDKKYLSAKKAAEELINKTIAFNANEKIISIDKKIIGNWVIFQNSGNNIIPSFSESKILSWVSSGLAPQVDIAPEPTILNYKGDLITQGKDGIALNQNDALSKIKSFIASGKNNITIKLITSPVTAPIERQTADQGPNPGMAEGRYIEIDLSQQMMYLFEGMALLASYRVSSGMASLPTPTGTFSILNKNPRAYSAKYNLYMPYWQAFTNNGHGIHELPERPDGTKEGESSLGWPVSHGCVRVGVGAAATVYGFTQVGTPVFIHQ